MANKKNIFFLLLLLVPILLGVFYAFVLRDYVIQAIVGEGPAWIEFIAETLYPRFEAESNRLPIDFFIEKADQVVIRAVLVSVVVFSIFFFYNKNDRFKNRIKRFSEEPSTLDNLFFLRILFFLLLLIATRDVYEDLRALKIIDSFYKPVVLLDIFNAPFPGKRISFIIYSLLFLSSILVVFGIRPIFFAVIAAFTFILYQALLFSFEKIDHGYGPFTYCCLLFPFLLWERRTCKEKNLHQFSSWSLKLIMIVISLVYFMTGVEKVLVSGFHWISADSFKVFLELHPTKAGSYVAQSEILTIVLPTLALLFQLAFPLILFCKNLKWVILLSGIAFHTGTVLLFAISSYENPWIFTYIFFIDWTTPGKALSGLPAYFRT